MSKENLHENFMKRFSEKGKIDEIEIFGKYININLPIKCKCKKCKREFEKKPQDLLYKKIRMPLLF